VARAWSRLAKVTVTSPTLVLMSVSIPSAVCTAGCDPGSVPVVMVALPSALVSGGGCCGVVMVGYLAFGRCRIGRRVEPHAVELSGGV
jgi:hypothetical protein